jgi:hypothetical protein
MFNGIVPKAYQLALQNINFVRLVFKDKYAKKEASQLLD